MLGIAPKDELEGMFAAELIACHNASMECYRRAIVPDQGLEARHTNLNSANKLSAPMRLCSKASTGIAAKGGRRSRSSTSTSMKAARLSSATSRPRGEGLHRKQRNNPMHLPMHQAKRCRARTRRGTECQSPAMKNGRCRMHGERHRARQRGIETPSSTGAILPRRLRDGERLRSCSGRHDLFREEPKDRRGGGVMSLQI